MDTLEDCSSRVVSLIEKTITVIKNEEAFSPSNRKRPPIAEVPLATILESQGVIEGVVETVRFVAEKLSIRIRIACAEDVASKDERTKVVYLILLPLLDALFECYQLFDEIPQPPPPPLSIRKKEKKPPPPRGMLSIQNYTDIAAFLEFTVCTSLLPCLDTNVLASVRDRAQYLIPKSLAGRLSRISLLWGSAVAAADKDGEPTDSIRQKELAKTVTLLGCVVLLDRFRPMLLPRHLADFYAGVFQAQALQTTPPKESDAGLESLRARLVPTTGTTAGVVDSFSQARALQTLLLRGTKAPLWLRKRASPLLTDLASRDMAAIVQVFVTSASSSQEDMTGASLRLVKALVAVQSNVDESYYSKLCQQLVRLLDVNVEKMNTSDFAGALTVWAFLDQLPRSRLRQNFLPVLAEGVFPGTASSFDLHQMVRRLMALSSAIPSSQNTTAFCELLLAPISTTRQGINLLGQLVRIASLTTLEGNVKVKSDATIALRMVCSVMERATFKAGTAAVKGTDLLPVALLNAISPNEWDTEGRRYQLSIGGETKPKGKLTFLNEEERTVDEMTIFDDVEKRSVLVVSEVVAFLADEEGSGNEAKVKSALPQSLFRHLLLTIFFLSRGNNTLSPNVRLVVMVVLPTLCERCSPEALLLGASTDACGIIATFKLLLDCAAAYVDDTFSQTQDASLSDIVVGFDNAKNKFLDLMSTTKDEKYVRVQETVRDDGLEDTLMSAASISLSLLTAMLELGSKQRNQQEVALLESTIPSLLVLSTFGAKSISRDYEMGKAHAEMAEMASHAAALIASLGATVDPNVTPGTVEDSSIPMLIKEAERDIKSEHPAIRARAVVQLRHLARGYLLERGERLPSKSLIVDVSESTPAANEHDTLNEIMGIAVLTLGDTESYVYLAGIQTIVAIVDVHPRTFIDTVALGVCTGKFRLGEESNNVVQLNQDERVKLSEALLFIVRRRGVAINAYVSTLIHMMVYGYHKLAKGAQPGSSKLIQQVTHAYFSEDPGDLNELTEQSEYFDAKQLRVGTGGPIFETELHDILRSSCIAVVAEIVSQAQPSTVAPYASELVRFVSNAMNLGVARLVRRAAALLGVSLYDAALREVEEAPEEAKLTVALVIGKEESMKSALEVSIDPVPSSSNLFDPATSARSQEAMAVRKQLEDTGAFVAAAIYVEVQRRQDDDPLISIVKRRLEEGREGKDQTGSLMIDLTGP
jgi:hypothetical protein